MNRFILTALVFAVATAMCAQDRDDFYAGLIINEAEYENVPVKAELLTRDFATLPSSYSLQRYAPTPKDQGKYGTCTSWATSYAARTICEAVANGWTDRATINSHTFSPPFIYTLIKDKDDSECSKGSSIIDALTVMKSKGVASYKDFNPACADYVPNSVFAKAIDNRIDSYSRVFPSNATAEAKIRNTKKALSQNHPVVFGMECYASLSGAGDYWNGRADRMRGYHAMCVVGYDDHKYGGSFLIMNSWGTSWGNGGFTWVKYTDFARYTEYAFDMYVAPKSDDCKMEGSFYLQLATGERMPVKLNSASGIPSYKASNSYISGTRYRIYISNNEPAYVYVIGSDLNNSVSKVFPPTDRISPALVYKSNNIALPDEQWFIEMDNTVGTDYVCVLYSSEELPIGQIVSTIRNASGSFYQKLQTALGNRLVPRSNITLQSGSVAFSARTEKTVVPIVLEVTHR